MCECQYVYLYSNITANSAVCTLCITDIGTLSWIISSLQREYSTYVILVRKQFNSLRHNFFPILSSTHQFWVGRGCIEWEVCLTLLYYMTSRLRLIFFFFIIIFFNPIASICNEILNTSMIPLRLSAQCCFSLLVKDKDLVKTKPNNGKNKWPNLLSRYGHWWEKEQVPI